VPEKRELYSSTFIMVNAAAADLGSGRLRAATATNHPIRRWPPACGAGFTGISAPVCEARQPLIENSMSYGPPGSKLNMPLLTRHSQKVPRCTQHGRIGMVL